MAKTSLNRQSYIDTALDLIADAGVEKLSMRKVASRLGVSPMAMYKHFPSKEELLAATLDEVILRADIYPDDSLPWDQWIEHVGRGMYQALCEESSWVPMLGSMRLGSQAAAVTDAFVQRLCTEGFSVEQAVRAYFAVIQVVIGAACLRSSINLEAGSDNNDGLAPVTLAYLANVDPRRLKIAPEFEQLVRLDQLDIGLPLVIAALRSEI